MRTWWLVSLMCLMLGACGTSIRTPKVLSASSLTTDSPKTQEWQGRISVQVLGDSPSSMSASFLLRGNADNGELDLYSPLGTTLGTLQWTQQLVQLSDGGKRQYFNSLTELTEKVTGAALPVDAIFAWLAGSQLQANGWQTDLSAVSQGSLTAHRTDPAPEVTLRIKLDQ